MRRGHQFTIQQVTELTDATPPPHYRKFVADYRKPFDASFQPNNAMRQPMASPNRPTRIIANAELYNPPFVRPPLFLSAVPHPPPPYQDSSPVRVSGRGSVRQTVSSAGNSVNYTLTAALQNPRMQQPPVSSSFPSSIQQYRNIRNPQINFDCPRRTRLSLWPS